MRLILTVAAAVALAGPALAALAPQYYQEARDKAAHVVVVKVERVNWVRPANGRGDCVVMGRVEAVERGGHYRVGQRARIAVPCLAPNAEMMPGPVIWQTPAALRGSKRGRAWMNQPGKLALYQYEILP